VRLAWVRTASILLALSLRLSTEATAQDERAAADDERLAATRALRCQTPANPRRMQAECVGQPFDFADTLSRGWAGVRSELRELGITPTASYTAQLMGNPIGGQSTGVTYAGSYELLLHWDVARLFPVSGLSLTLGAAWSTGRSLSADEIGNIFTVQSAYTAPDGQTNSVTLGPMYLQQRLLDDRLMLAAGRLAPAETFATMPVLNNYLNGGINAVPGSLTTNVPSFASYPPGVQWGAQGLYYLTPTVQVAAGVFNASADAAAGVKSGTDFSLGGRGTGVLSVIQATYVFDPGGVGAGLPGLYTLGGLYDSSGFSRLAGPDSTENGNDSVYVLFQQMVYREGGPRSLKGLTVWGEVAVAPRSSVSPLPLFVGGGLSYLGLVPGRRDDVASLGAIHGRLSRDLPGTSSETVIEANYQFVLTGGLSITPDLQYVIRPGGDRTVRDALVLGAQVTISF
jgi:porin